MPAFQASTPPAIFESLPDANLGPAPADLGAAYGTAKSGVGICSMGVMHPGLIMKCEWSPPP